MIRLGVNIDHCATVRQARKTIEPDLIEMAKAAIAGGAHGITAHLREDRRHIQDKDVYQLNEFFQDEVDGILNLEMGLAEDILTIACDIKPDWVCLVPEKREELTTEGGLLISGKEAELQKAIDRLHQAGSKVSLFVEPDCEVIDQAVKLGADAVELHTGAWANAWLDAHEFIKDNTSKLALDARKDDLHKAAQYLCTLPLSCHAGHGMTYRNTHELCDLTQVEEFNIGHSIVCRALGVGMEQAVRELFTIMNP